MPNRMPQGVTVRTNATQWVRLDDVCDDHVDRSTAFVRDAMQRCSHNSVLILGVGAGRELPLTEIAETFDRVVLVDINREELDQAHAAVQAVNTNCEALSVDLTGLSESIELVIGQVLDAAGDPGSGADLVAAITESLAPTPWDYQDQFDLVIASCVLSQLHVHLSDMILQMFQHRFPGYEPVLLDYERYQAALYQLARLTESQFMEHVNQLIAPGGRMFLSATMFVSFIHQTDQGLMTEGYFSMLKSRELKDYVDDTMTVERSGNWHWVVNQPINAGDAGRLYGVQGLLLTKA